MLPYRIHSLILLILLWNPSCTGQCSRIKVRREIRELTSASRSRFINAINQLKRNGDYDRITRSHNEEFRFFHWFPMFFPWHRLYIRRFEQALQNLDPSITLPYWDWTKDADSPVDSPVFTWFGGDGSGDGGCVLNGPFAGWNVATPNRHCLQRTFRQDDFNNLYSNSETMNDIIESASDYHELRLMIEQRPHGGVHHSIGGDMDQSWSSNDPLFWIHHSYVDKVWWNWQRAHPNANGYNGRTFNGQQASIHDNLPELGLQVSQVLDINDLCYTYSNDEDEERGTGDGDGDSQEDFGFEEGAEEENEEEYE